MVLGQEPVVQCVSCIVLVHRECWRYVGKCSTFGCECRLYRAPAGGEGEGEGDATASPLAPVEMLMELDPWQRAGAGTLVVALGFLAEAGLIGSAGSLGLPVALLAPLWAFMAVVIPVLGFWAGRNVYQRLSLDLGRERVERTLELGTRTIRALEPLSWGHGTELRILPEDDGRFAGWLLAPLRRPSAGASSAESPLQALRISPPFPDQGARGEEYVGELYRIAQALGVPVITPPDRPWFDEILQVYMNASRPGFLEGALEEVQAIADAPAPAAQAPAALEPPEAILLAQPDRSGTRTSPGSPPGATDLEPAELYECVARRAALDREITEEEQCVLAALGRLLDLDVPTMTHHLARARSSPSDLYHPMGAPDGRDLYRDILDVIHRKGRREGMDEPTMARARAMLGVSAESHDQILAAVERTYRMEAGPGLLARLGASTPSEGPESLLIPPWRDPEREVTRFSDPAEDRCPVGVEEDVLSEILEMGRSHHLVLTGLLMGRYHDRAGDDFVTVDSWLPGRLLPRDVMRLSWTSQALAALLDEKARRHPARDVIGWQLSIPGMTPRMYLASKDFHLRHFMQPWEVTLVLDPLAGQYRMFRRRGAQVEKVGFFLLRSRRREPRTSSC